MSEGVSESAETGNSAEGDSIDAMLDGAVEAAESTESSAETEGTSEQTDTETSEASESLDAAYDTITDTDSTDQETSTDSEYDQGEINYSFADYVEKVPNPKNNKKPSELEAALSELKESGVSDGDIEAILEQIDAIEDIDNTENGRGKMYHEWENNLGRYLRRQKNLKGWNIYKTLKGIIFLATALLDVHDPKDQDVQGTINDGTRIFYMSGWLAAPRQVPEGLREEVGENIGYLAINDHEKLMSIFREAYNRSGKLTLVGFSDGVTVLDQMRQEYGAELDKMVHGYVVYAGDPVKNPGQKVREVILSDDRLASLSPHYTWRDKGSEASTRDFDEIEGGHAWFYNRKTSQQLGKIIRESVSPYTQTYKNPMLSTRSASVKVDTAEPLQRAA